MSQSNSVRFSYEKSSQCLTVHADGAWVSITPSGQIQVGFFSDLRPLPEALVASLPLIRDVITDIDDDRDSVIRNVECFVVVHPEIARRVVDLLNYMLEEVDKQASELTPCKD